MCYKLNKVIWNRKRRHQRMRMWQIEKRPVCCDKRCGLLMKSILFFIQLHLSLSAPIWRKTGASFPSSRTYYYISLLAHSQWYKLLQTNSWLDLNYSVRNVYHCNTDRLFYSTVSCLFSVFYAVMMHVFSLLYK